MAKCHLGNHQRDLDKPIPNPRHGMTLKRAQVVLKNAKEALEKLWAT
jgi:hypothetical protein